MIKDSIIGFVIGLLISMLMLMIIYKQIDNNKENKNEVLIDTLYNKVVLDSIKWNIVEKDTIIYNIKQEMYEEIENSKLLNDSDAVILFQELVRE